MWPCNVTGCKPMLQRKGPSVQARQLRQNGDTASHRHMATTPQPRPRAGRSRISDGLGLCASATRRISRLPRSRLLVAAAATVSIPWGFKLVIDKGFGAGAGNARDIAPWFELLLGVVAVMALATATRFYFVSWLGRADRRRHPPRRAPQPAAPVARLLRGEPAGRDHVADHGRHHDHRAGGRNDGVGRAAQHRHGRRLRRHHVRARAQARRARCCSASRSCSVRSSFSGAGCARSRPATRTRIAEVGTVTSEVLGAMKIVQAFNQQGRETPAFRRRGRARVRDRQAPHRAPRDA